MKPVKGPRLGSGPAHQKLMLGGLAAALISHERIRTTETKAKRLRPVAERLVTLGKSGTVQARRRALSIVTDRTVVHKLFAEVAPRFAERQGGYTRIVRLGPRQGDAAPMAIIEWVEETVEAKPAGEDAGARSRRLGRRRGARKADKPASGADAAAPAANAEESEVEEELPAPAAAETAKLDAPEPAEVTEAQLQTESDLGPDAGAKAATETVSADENEKPAN